jgi:hypothetical protein
MAEIFTGVVGLEVRLTFRNELGEPLSLTEGGTTVVVRLERQGDPIREYGAAEITLGPEDHALRLRTQEGDIATPGRYGVQGWVTIPGQGVYPSDIARFEVSRSIPAGA